MTDTDLMNRLLIAEVRRLEAEVERLTKANSGLEQQLHKRNMEDAAPMAAPLPRDMSTYPKGSIRQA